MKKTVLTLFLLSLLSPVLGQTSQEPVIAFDNATQIQDVSWGTETVTVTFNSSIPRLAKIVDSNSIETSGASIVKTRTVMLQPGLTQASVQVETRSGDKTITVTVQDRTVALSNPQKPLLQDVNVSNVYIGILSGAVWLLINLVSQHKYQIRKIRKHPRKIL